jgi:hypothetical protein
MYYFITSGEIAFMEKRILFLILFLLAPMAAHAADISGFVRNAKNQPVPDATVEYICGEKTYKGKTNKYGRYRVTGMPKVTWCSVNVNGKQVSKKINSGSGSKEVDLRI